MNRSGNLIAIIQKIANRTNSQTKTCFTLSGRENPLKRSFDIMSCLCGPPDLTPQMRSHTDILRAETITMLSDPGMLETVKLLPVLMSSPLFGEAAAT